MIKAKPVIPNQFWILRDHDHKVGNIEADNGEFIVSLNGAQHRFKSLRTLKDNIQIDFEKTSKKSINVPTHEVHGFPTTGNAYNAIFDVKHQLPLWTQEPRSRSWLAAGWYRVQQHRDWRMMQCPKLIILQRYPYQGPFRTLKEAQAS
jgi:hypothetical protein